MKTNNPNSLALGLLILSLCLLTLEIFLKPGFASDPLMDREGRTLKVRIDGAYTKAIPEKDIQDAYGVPAYTVHWSAPNSTSPKCIFLSTHDSRLGEPERVDIIIREISAEKPHHRWKDYKILPSSEGNSGKFLAGEGFCISEFYLTESTRIATLPAGEYVLYVSYYGKGNWDRQSIILTVK